MDASLSNMKAKKPIHKIPIKAKSSGGSLAQAHKKAAPAAVKRPASQTAKSKTVSSPSKPKSAPPEAELSQ